jgi:hypothetical protein
MRHGIVEIDVLYLSVIVLTKLKIVLQYSSNLDVNPYSVQRSIVHWAMVLFLPATWSPCAIGVSAC